MSKEKPIKCYECGEQTPFEESLGAETGKRGKWRDVCRTCYDEIVSHCTICDSDDVMPSQVSRFILAKAEFSTTGDRPPGIYKVLSYPFYFASMLGGGEICNYDIRFVDRLPKPDAEYEISGRICIECSKPYERTLKRVYGRKTNAHGFDKAAQKLEVSHTRRTILRHPEMLRDLECDATRKGPDGNSLSYANDNDWKDLQKLYDLPDGLPTFHEWLLLKFKGVKVFKTCSQDRYGSSWLSLSPEPRFRSGAGRLFPQTFSASSLPMFPEDKDDGQYHSPYEWEDQHSIPAIKEAIRRGLIKQHGTFDAQGKPCTYG